MDNKRYLEKAGNESIWLLGGDTVDVYLRMVHSPTDDCLKHVSESVDYSLVVFLFTFHILAQC